MHAVNASLEQKQGFVGTLNTISTQSDHCSLLVPDTDKSKPGKLSQDLCQKEGQVELESMILLNV